MQAQGKVCVGCVLCNDCSNKFCGEMALWVPRIETLKQHPTHLLVILVRCTCNHGYSLAVLLGWVLGSLHPTEYKSPYVLLLQGQTGWEQELANFFFQKVC